MACRQPGGQRDRSGTSATISQRRPSCAWSERLTGWPARSPCQMAAVRARMRLQDADRTSIPIAVAELAWSGDRTESVARCIGNSRVDGPLYRLAERGVGHGSETSLMSDQNIRPDGQSRSDKLGLPDLLWSGTVADMRQCQSAADRLELII
jgi:hypothetical protein